MKRKKIPYGTKLPVILTQKERDLIRNETYYDPRFASVAISEGNKIKINLTLGDIEEIQGYVAACGNHTANNKLQNEMDRLFLKLQKFLDKYDDQD
jgi:hypothetical protein